MFECAVEQYPPPRISWKRVKTNKQIPTEKLVEYNKQTSFLKFEKVSRNDAGVYICYIKNNQNVYQEYELIVKCM